MNVQTQFKINVMQQFAIDNTLKFLSGDNGQRGKQCYEQHLWTISVATQHGLKRGTSYTNTNDYAPTNED